MNTWLFCLTKYSVLQFWASPHQSFEGLLFANDFRSERLMQMLKVYDPGFPRDDPSEGPPANPTQFPTDVPAPEPHDVPAPEPRDVPPPDPGDDPAPNKPAERPQQDPKPRPIP